MTITLRVEAPALTLRPWHADDVEALVEIYRDPAVRRWTGLPFGTAEDAHQWLAVQHRGWATGERLSFAVVEDHRVAGYVVLKRPGAEVGYWTAAHARGRGIAPAALDALTTWAVDTFSLDRIDLLHQVDNTASCRVAEKAGYPLHRILPAHPPDYPLDGHLHTRG